MEELLSELDKFNVKTEEELFVDQFSKLSAGNQSTENKPQPFPSNQYATHKMFGNDITHSKTTTSLKQGNINITNINVNTNAIINSWQRQFEMNNDAVGWNQAKKANDDDEGWGHLPDVNTSVNPNHAFGMSSILSAEILNLGNANVNQQRIFGSGYSNNNSNNDENANTTQTAKDVFRLSNQ